jgi:hypothetical protein
LRGRDFIDVKRFKKDSAESGELRLFDQRRGTVQDPRRRNEPLFEYLNNSARSSAESIRYKLEEWFARLSPAVRRDLRGRFRSPKSDQHFGAFWELYLHQLFLSLGFRVEANPTVPGTEGTRPDFLVSKEDRPLFYIEATLALSSDAERTSNRHADEVYDTLDKLKSPDFFLDIQVAGRPAGPVPGADLRAKLEPWLRTLDPEKITDQIEKIDLDSVPPYRYIYRGWELEIRPIPKSPEHRGRSGIRSVGIIRPEELIEVTGRGSSPIREAVRSKATRIGLLDLPFVIAVNAMLPFAEMIDVMEALFGTEEYVAYRSGAIRDAPDVRITRRPDGALYGPQGEQNTRVSGIIFVSGLHPWSMHEKTLELILNPRASHPFHLEHWPFPYWRENPARDRILRTNGATAPSLLKTEKIFDTE